MLNQTIVAAVEACLKQMLVEAAVPWPNGLHIAVEHPAKPEHGEYSVNVAMQLAKVLKKPQNGRNANGRSTDEALDGWNAKWPKR